MLEMLLMAFKTAFGFDFPLKDYEGEPEIDVINIIYACLQANDPNYREAVIKNRFPNAPGLKQEYDGPK